jgi:hypothetical protein
MFYAEENLDTETNTANQFIFFEKTDKKAFHILRSGIVLKHENILRKAGYYDFRSQHSIFRQIGS